MTGVFSWIELPTTAYYCTDKSELCNPTGLDFSEFCTYACGMESKMGRPPKDRTGPKRERMEIRVEASEKQAMEATAKDSGVSLSDWARKVLLRAARRKKT